MGSDPLRSPPKPWRRRWGIAIPDRIVRSQASQHTTDSRKHRGVTGIPTDDSSNIFRIQSFRLFRT